MVTNSRSLKIGCFYFSTTFLLMHFPHKSSKWHWKIKKFGRKDCLVVSYSHFHPSLWMSTMGTSPGLSRYFLHHQVILYRTSKDQSHSACWCFLIEQLHLPQKYNSTLVIMIRLKPSWLAHYTNNLVKYWNTNRFLL